MVKMLLFNETKESRILYIILHILRHISYHGGLPSNDIRVLDNHNPNNPFFWNRYNLIVDFNEVINFVDVIDL